MFELRDHASVVAGAFGKGSDACAARLERVGGASSITDAYIDGDVDTTLAADD